MTNRAERPDPGRAAATASDDLAAAATTTTDGLAALAATFWDGLCEASPLLATANGDRRFDDRLDDITPAATAREIARLERVVDSARAIDPAELTEEDRVTREVLIEEATGRAALATLGIESWNVDPLAGWHNEIQDVASYQPVRTPAEARMMVERWRRFGPLMDDHTTNLRRGLVEGRVGVRTPIAKVVEALAATLAVSDEESGFLEPLRVARDDWPAEELAAFRDGLTTALHEGIRPALARHRAFLEVEVLPRARPDERAGICHIDGGRAAYATLVRFHTTLDRSPEELHAIGLAEVARINDEIEELGRRVLGAADRTDALGRLRDDPAMHFATRDEVEATARQALLRAEATVPAWFGRTPTTPCEVVRMPAHEEENATIAYYRQPALDGSRPGQYYINTGHPETRPRYDAECLAFHESVPGHHLQIAIAQELGHLPTFRRNLGPTAFWEGWGLYSERLADEMGLYSSDLDRIGMLSMDSWRACRLVVDTGIHALGWSRQAAIDFMVGNSALAANNIANEVDRYIVWPGQALAYKSGQLELLALRREAESTLGERFDIRAFHDLVLESGAVALRTLRRIVQRRLADPRLEGTRTA
ncbi:MAG: DUF885 domain-containing protein [Chloroflexi bacterium]|nr:DUF885 domain-containing protein [Chloroflexota bacterium]